MIFLSLPLLHKAEEKAKVNRAAQAERRLRLCKTSCIPQRQQSNHRCSAGVGVHGLLPGSVSSAKDDAEQGCCLLSAPKAASWLRPGTLSIPWLRYPPSGKGHILSQQGMFSSLYVFPSPIAPILSSSHARNCDHGKPWKPKQTESNPSREGRAALDEMHQSLDNVLSNALSKQHLLLEPSHPPVLLSEHSCAFSHSKTPSPLCTAFSL